MLNTEQIIAQINFVGGIVLIIAIIIAILKIVINRMSANIKGKTGEGATHLGLLFKLNSAEYSVLSDLIIPFSGGSAQIDNLVVSPYGIFVIEVKNYKGWIFGNEKDANWVQNIYGKKNYFMNPLRQNFKHIKALSEYLNLDESYFHNVVFFIGDCIFKTKMPENVLNRGLSKYIKSKDKKILNENKMNEILNKLKETKRKIKISKKEHLENIKNYRG